MYADIIQIFSEDEQRMGKIRVNGVLKNVPMLLLPDAKEGDRVLMCDGIPISKMSNDKKGGDYVFGDSGKSN